MWCGCHVVVDPWRSARIGTDSSATTITTKPTDLPRPRQHEHDQPAQHAHRDPERVPKVGAARWRVAVGGPEPLAGQADPHDRVAERHDGEVVVLEQAGHPGGEDEHAGDLHEDGQAVGEVVGVIGRREPREVHPCPPDGEEDHRVRREGLAGVARDEGVVEAAARPGPRPRRSRGRRTAPMAWRRGAPRRHPGPASGGPTRPGSDRAPERGEQ